MRYRRDIIDESKLTFDQKRALNAVDALLADPYLVQYYRIPPQCIAFYDNGRFLHGRTPVRDPKRHLKRIRFHM